MTAVDCTFARGRSPLAPAHDHTRCAAALATTSGRWHPESVVISTRRLLALAAQTETEHARPSCASCGVATFYDVDSDEWVHENREPVCDPYATWGTQADPGMDQLADWCETRIRDAATTTAAVPWVAALALMEFGPWNPDLPDVLGAIEDALTEPYPGTWLAAAWDRCWAIGRTGATR